jgi:hypothetical protein
MSDASSPNFSSDKQIREILEHLLQRDEDITARALARLHPTIKAASSITRSESRRTLLAEYQDRQREYRRWRGHVGKKSGAQVAGMIADKDMRIADLESKVAILTASHVAMLRVVGESGGFAKWAAFFDDFRQARDKLDKLGALPMDQSPSRSIESQPKRFDNRSR